MRSEVDRLVTEAPRLVAVRGTQTGGQRFTALALDLPDSTIHLYCDDDTDEILIDVTRQPPDYPNVILDSVTELIEMRITDAWQLTNHRGYNDAVQFRFTDGAGRYETRQFEVGASAIDIFRVVG
jgi:hypothetical protein